MQDPDWMTREAQWGVSPPAYAYARNNPVRYTDRTGLETEDEKACMTEFEKREAAEDRKCKEKFKSRDACVMLKNARWVGAMQLCKESRSQLLDRVFSPDAGPPTPPKRKPPVRAPPLLNQPPR